MASQSFPAYRVTGPVHHYVAAPLPTGGGYIYYLGTAEVQPIVRWQPQMKPIMNDIGGGSIPVQYKDDGEMATIAVNLNYVSLRALDYIGAMGGNSGRQGRFSRGQPILGLKSFRLWQVFENWLDVGTRALYPDLPIGYYWPQVKWVDLQDAPGNIDQKKNAAWECIPYFTPQNVYSAVAAGEREWVLYSTAAADFPTDVRVPQ